jgi:putative heme-binding domain-containing protein
VLNSPNLTVYYDDNHTGKANRSEVLLTGISTEDFVKQRGGDHTTNGITMGIDGWIYIAVGDFGFMHCVSKDGKVLQNHGGGVARVRPDGTELEMVSVNERNIYGVGVDPLLNIFTRDNTNDGDGWDVRFHHIVPNCNVGYPMLYKHFQEDLLPRIADYGGGAPCGTVFVDEPGLPEGFGHVLYTCDWGRGWVYRHPMKADGATFSVQQEQFLGIAHPTDMRLDGRGNMYVTSWRNGGFSYDGPNIGFVVRLTPEGAAKRATFPDLAKMADGELVAKLAAESQILRINAQREVLRRGAKPGIVDGVKQLAASAKTSPAGRVAAIFTLKQLLGTQATPTLVKLTEDAAVREWALKALADRKTQLEGVPAGPFLKALNDESPRVRVQALVGLTRMNKRDAADAILALTDDKDHVVAHIAGRSLILMHADDSCIAALDHAESPTYGGAVNVLKWFHDAKVVDALIAHLASQKDAAARRPLITALCRLYFTEGEWDGRWWGTRPTSAGPYYRWVTWDQSEKIGKVLKEAMAAAGDADTTRFLLTEFGRHHLDTPDVVKQMVELAKKDPAFKATVIDLLASNPNPTPEGLALLEEVAKSPKEDVALRGKALRTLTNANSKEALDAAVRALAAIGAEAPGELRNARESFLRDGKQQQNLGYFTKLASSEDAGTREVAYGALTLLANSNRASQRTRDSASAAVEQGWKSPASAASLLRAIGQTKLNVYASQVSARLTDADPAIQQAAAYAAAALKISGAAAAAAGKTMADIPYEEALAKAQKLKGDPTAGQQIFLRQGCVACHTVNPEDPPKGPFLGDIAVRYPLPEIIESVLKPNAKIAQGFQTYWFEFKDKDRKEGFVVREGGDEVEIRDITGASTTIKLADIAKRGKLDTSIMPENIAGNLTMQEFGDLLAYLESMKGSK